MDLETPHMAKISKFRAFSGQNPEARGPRKSFKVFSGMRMVSLLPV